MKKIHKHRLIKQRPLRYGRERGEKRVTCHSLRHACATWGGLRAICRDLYGQDKLREAECELADMPPLPEKLWVDALRRFCKRRGWYGPVDIGDILPLPGPEIP